MFYKTARTFFIKTVRPRRCFIPRCATAARILSCVFRSAGCIRDNYLFPNILVDRQRRAKMCASRFNFTLAAGMKSDTRGSSFNFIYGIPRRTVNDGLTSRDRKTILLRHAPPATLIVATSVACLVCIGDTRVNAVVSVIRMY